MTIMLQLANALVIDLGINKKYAIRAAYHRTEASLRSYPEEEPQVKQLTLEECRAFLGHKYLNSAFVLIVIKPRSNPSLHVPQRLNVYEIYG